MLIKGVINKIINSYTSNLLVCVVNKLRIMIVFCITIFLALFGTKTDALYDNDIDLDCFGKTFQNTTLTAYYPDYTDEDNAKAYLDKRGKKLQTLQDYLDDRSVYVTLAMDEKLGIPYGTKVCIPELNIHFGHRIRLEVRDSSYDLENSGFRRADVCVRTEIDSYDINVNRQVTLVFPKQD